jgi:hypothetical protein
MIHGPYNIKSITAQQAKIKHTYENSKMKLYKCIAANGSTEQYVYYHIPIQL